MKQAETESFHILPKPEFPIILTSDITQVLERDIRAEFKHRSSLTSLYSAAAVLLFVGEQFETTQHAALLGYHPLLGTSARGRWAGGGARRWGAASYPAKIIQLFYLFVTASVV
jgi:hypothetical protein